MSDLPCFRFFLVGLLETTSVFSAVLREVHWTRLTGIFTDQSLTFDSETLQFSAIEGGVRGHWVGSECAQRSTEWSCRCSLWVPLIVIQEF